MMNAASELSDSRRRELAELGAATLGESGAIALSPRIRPMWKGAAFAGPVMTAACAAGDNLAVHAAVAAGRPLLVPAVFFARGSVLGGWGEVLTTAARAPRVAPLGSARAVRDVAGIPH